MTAFLVTYTTRSGRRREFTLEADNPASARRELRRREGAERLGAAPALEVSAVADAAEYRRLAAEHFGIELSGEQAQRVFDADAPPQ